MHKKLMCFTYAFFILQHRPCPSVKSILFTKLADATLHKPIVRHVWSREELSQEGVNVPQIFDFEHCFFATARGVAQSWPKPFSGFAMKCLSCVGGQSEDVIVRVSMKSTKDHFKTKHVFRKKKKNSFEKMRYWCRFWHSLHYGTSPSCPSIGCLTFICRKRGKNTLDN